MSAGVGFRNNDDSFGLELLSDDESDDEPNDESDNESDDASHDASDNES